MSRRAAPIAVIGVSCLTACGTDARSLWDRLGKGTPAFTEVPSQRFRWQNYHSADPRDQDTGSVWRGAFLEELEIPWREYKMGPKMLDELHRFELYTVEAIRRVMADARLIDRPFSRERTAVIMGASELGTDFRILYPYIWYVPDVLEKLQESAAFTALPEPLRRRILVEAERRYNEVSLRDVTRGSVSGMSLALGRACSLFDLRGPHYIVNAACASALAALDHAARGLELGWYDVALVGASSPYLGPSPFVTFDRMGVLTKAEHPRPFDANASGTLLGEGVGFLALRRLDDAIAAGDQIHGVIRGIGGANEGRRGALLRIGRQAQVIAASRAYEKAGYDPETVQYLECHANGVPELEETELSAMGEVFRSRAPQSLVVGSTKDVTGYLQSAAAIPGIIRTLMALRERTLPAQHHVQTPRAELCAHDTPFRILPEPADWRAPAASHPRRASVNAVGIGGHAYHMTLEEWSPEYHERLAAEWRSRPVTEPVAVVALGAVAPGANDSETFWQNIIAKRDQIGPIPPERFDVERYYDPEGPTGKVTCRLGGFISGFAFDGKSMGIPMLLEAQLDRSHLLSLTVAAEAMRQGPKVITPARTGVIMADMPGRLRERQVDLRITFRDLDLALREVLTQGGLSGELIQSISRDVEIGFKQRFAPLSAYSLAGYTGSTEAALIAHVYGFQGGCATFESTCASSLAAVEAAVASLQLEDLDCVLAGGVFGDMAPELYVINSTFGGLSRSGSRPFDADASGFIPGEGAGILVLKRLSDAERDGDHILGLILGVGSSSDGQGKSLLAPNPVGQELAVRRALERAGADPASIQYIECHGTATPVGDYTEATTYARVYGGRPPGSIAMGSVKSMIGHLHSAAGVINLVKVLKSMEHKVLPPQINFDRPNPDIRWDEFPCRVVTEVEPWPAREGGRARRAAVSGFGMGGTNFHVIVEEYVGSSRVQQISDRKAYPMIDQVLQTSADRLVVARDLRLDTDLYLADHQYNGVAMLPGAFGVELMAEVAALLKPGLQVIGFDKVRFMQTAKVWPSRPTRLIATAESGPESQGVTVVSVQVETEFQIRHDLPPQRTLVYSGTVQLSANLLPAASLQPEMARLARPDGRLPFQPVYNRTDDVWMGPTMQGCQWYRFPRPDQFVTWSKPPEQHALFSFTSEPAFIFSPLALDAYLHGAGTLACYRDECVVLPAGLDGIRIHQRPPEDREVCTIVTYQTVNEGIAALKSVVADSETGNILLEIDRVELYERRKVGPVMAPVLVVPRRTDS